MLDYLKKILSKSELTGSNNINTGFENSESKRTQIAACALFIEIAKADGEFSDDEKEFIMAEIQRTFNLESQYVSELMELAASRVKDSVSLYEFTSLINTTFSQLGKIELLESLWKLIYSDDKLNVYEDNMIKKIGATLNVEHKQIINAKLWVKEQMGIT
jgi:uncharacterized tellurite resistance protein B-like protein